MKMKDFIAEHAIDIMKLGLLAGFVGVVGSYCKKPEPINSEEFVDEDEEPEPEDGTEDKEAE